MTALWRALVPVTAFAAACHPNAQDRRVEPGRRAPDVPGELRVTGVPLDTLTAHVVADSALLHNPIAVSASANYVAVADNSADSALVLFSTPTRQFAGEVGPPYVGSPRRFWVWSIEPSADVADAFTMFDPAQRKLVTIGVGRSVGVRRVIRVDSAPSVLQPIPITGGRFYSTGLRLSGRFGLFTADGQLVRTLGPMPPGVDSLPVYIRQHAYQAGGTLNPSGDRLALAYRYTDRVEVYDTAGRLVARAPRPLRFDPVYDVRRRGGAPALSVRDDSRIAYVSLTGDSARVYALFSGRTIGAFRNRAFYGTAVHVYGWDGTLERVVPLSRETVQISVDPAGRWLYAVEPFPTPRLVAYPLPPATDPHGRARAAVRTDGLTAEGPHHG